MALGSEPPAPAAGQLRNAHLALARTVAAANSYLAVFELRVSQRGPAPPTDHDFNLLRAMLVSACSGLDSMVKHAIRDALPTMIDRVDRAQDSFRAFAARRLPPAHSVLNPSRTNVPTASATHAALIGELIRELTGKSLRSRKEILRAAFFFDLRSADLIVDTGLFDDAFHARNQITHGVDIDFMRPCRSRAHSPKQRYVDYTQAVLDCAESFLVGVDAKLGQHQCS